MHSRELRPVERLTHGDPTSVYSRLNSCYWLGVRILLIDDDVELCNLLAELLRREGFEVQMEHDGVTGLERASPAWSPSSCSRRVEKTWTASWVWSSEPTTILPNLVI